MSNARLGALHPTGAHPENPERLRALLEAFPDYVEGRSADLRDVLACHDPAYVEQVENAAGAGHSVLLDPDTIVEPTSFEAALLAAGCAIEATRIGGFALARPPGHHALPDRAMGFCLFNNAAIAARYAQRELGLARIAILDWDVHHGNGTEEIFRDDPSVLFVSLHQWPLYPGSGGPGTSDGTTVNIPLRAGCGDDEYLDAIERIAEPAIAGFAPDLLLVSAGYDAAAGDPLAGMELTAGGFRELGARAAGLCDRIALVLEGGYDPTTLPLLVQATLDGLSG